VLDEVGKQSVLFDHRFPIRLFAHAKKIRLPSANPDPKVGVHASCRQGLDLVHHKAKGSADRLRFGEGHRREQSHGRRDLTRLAVGASP
jgi:hypothetical protein